MKTIGSFVLLLFVFGTVASAATLSVTTVGDRDGHSGAGGAVVSNGSNLFYAGDPSPTFPHVYYGVVKYAIPTELSGQTITSASVNIRVIAHNPGEDGFVHVLLQKYTFDNTTAVGSADYTTPSVANIGVYSALPGAFMAWDVTAALQSDVNNGFAYSSYRATAVISPTDLTPVAITGGLVVNCCSAEGAVNVAAYAGLAPRLDVTYVPEPATLGLLALGAFSVLRRKV